MGKTASGLLAILALAWTACSRAPRPMVVGAKASTDSLILGEMIAALAEERLKIPVTRKFSMAGGAACANAVKVGDVDAYAESAGTALVGVLKEPAILDPAKALERVRSEFERRWGVRWLAPLGFNASYAVVMRREHADKVGVFRLSGLRDIERRLRCGLEAEFAERPDAYKGLLAHYDLEFCSSVSQMTSAAAYQSLIDGRVDAINGGTVDGRLRGLDLMALEDDQAYFIRYPTSVVLSARSLKRQPQAARVLGELSGRISDAEMLRLDAEVDVRKREPKEVAREFLKKAGLLP